MISRIRVFAGLLVLAMPAVRAERLEPARRLSFTRVHALAQTVPPGARAIRRLKGGKWLVSMPDWLAGTDVELPSAADKSSLAFAVSPTVVVVSFYEDITPADADAILQGTGVTPWYHADLRPSERLALVDPQQIRTLTEWDEVARVYPASAELIAGEPVYGCPDPDNAGTEIDLYTATEGEGWDGSGAGSADLTWSFVGASSALPTESVVECIGRALAEWSKYAALRFRRTIDSRAVRTVAYSFAKGEHLDPYPFDGTGKVLAHAFYPADRNPEPIAGDVHVDDDEPWTVSGDPDLYSVLLHETGHALGLGHSDKPGAVMYPYSRKLSGLQADDIQALGRLYASQTPAAGSLALSFSVPPFTVTSPIEVSGTITGGSGKAWAVWSRGNDGGPAQGDRQWRIPAIPLSTGDNTLVITARDEAQNVVSRHEVITYSPTFVPLPTQSTPQLPSGSGPSDHVNPTVSITRPSGSVHGTSAASIEIRGTARDNSAVYEVTWQCGSRNGVAVGTNAWSFTLPLLVGDNTIIVRATDAYGNVGWRSVLITRR